MKIYGAENKRIEVILSSAALHWTYNKNLD